MGGGHRYPYPKWVWSPAGGWWHTPKNANRSAIIYVGVCCVISYFVVGYCEPRTVSIATQLKVQLSILKSIAKIFTQADKSAIWTVTGILASVLGCLLSKAEKSRVRWSAPWTLECEKRGGIEHCTFQVEALKDWAGEWRLKFNPLNYFFLSILFLNILASHRLWRFIQFGRIRS